MPRTAFRAAGIAIALGLLLALPAFAGLSPKRFAGHLSVGYSRLFLGGSDTDAPGGSISVMVGLDYPVAERWRLGGEVGFALLGSSTIELDSLQTANLDFSAFETALLLHWSPQWGPIARVSFGPALMSARAEISTAGGSLAFIPYAVQEWAPGFALGVSLLKWQSPSPVLAGLELGVQTGYLEDQTWTIGSARVTIHY